MLRLFSVIDKLLRGGFTSREDLRLGRVGVPVGVLVVAGLLLGAIYGLFMGLYGVLRPQSPTALQLLSTTAKVPLLFLLTLLVTFPSLYVFSALAGSALRFADTLKLLLVGIVVNLALLASFGPVTGFFTLSTESYPFMIILNVLFFGLGGIAGLVFVRKALNTIFEQAEVRELPAAPKAKKSSKSQPTGDTQPAAAPPALHERRAKGIFLTWAVIYGVVGAQMGWILRPFIGSPHLPFQLFRERESHFFEAVLRTLGDLLGM